MCSSDLRANRRQNVTEFTACDPDTGACRVVVREQWPASWVENSPAMRYLGDEERFIWTSERDGFRNFYLYSLSGEQIATITDHAFEVGSIVRVDEDAGVLYYTARSGDNHMKMQLHRVGLDGSDDERSEEHTSELQSRRNLVCRLLLEKKKKRNRSIWFH